MIVRDKENKIQQLRETFELVFNDKTTKHLPSEILLDHVEECTDEQCAPGCSISWWNKTTGPTLGD